MSARSYAELQGFGGRPLTVSMIAAMDAQLAQCDRQLAGEIAHQNVPADAQTRDRYLSSALMENAIHSSLFEGAVSPREIAKDMLRDRRIARLRRPKAAGTRCDSLIGPPPRRLEQPATGAARSRTAPCVCRIHA
jgi:hypothetical protein